MKKEIHVIKLNFKKITTILAVLLLIIIAIFVIYNYNKEKIAIQLNGEEYGDISPVITLKGEQELLQKEEYIEKEFVSIDNVVEQKTAKNVSNETKGLPILMYHFFYDESLGQTGPDGNWMEISDFEEQMIYLSENNYYYPSWEEVRDYADGKITLPEKSVVVTIDDGDWSFFNLAVPILKKYNIKATSFVVTSWDGETKVASYKSNLLNMESHSHDMHQAGSDGKGLFLTISKEKALEDLNTSANMLGSSKAFCYPFGHNSDFTVDILKKAEFQVAVTTKGGRVYPNTDRYRLPRVRMSKGDSLNSFINKVK